ncbi:rhomboid family intramembrane serine protease [Fundicoccus culcitae]|uniref:Rhomboid family intramembrane serine protease n=1 Tax=Fundicoccus culcitae TaxID=2969821 RepID=A0ABY5P7W4_9LACT|nr:rhomboid family intramembrane serine protease [Fundicoccus culcitae]UUX34580.1 rhomboid family intramembrane serine protease [Fundicoccus culcitae]
MNRRFKRTNKPIEINRNMPYMTYLFLLICVAVYLYTLIRYRTTQNTLVLIATGAKVNELMVFGNEWWRLITAAFVHIGFEHILMNGISIYFIGSELEQIMGHWRFAILYLVSAIGGNILSFAFSPNVSAGASTALFGTFAAFLVLAYLYPNYRYLTVRARSFAMLLLINLIMGLFSTGIDYWGHIGGAIYGVLITFVLGLPQKNDFPKRYKAIALLVIIGISALLIWFGIQKVYANYR